MSPFLSEGTPHRFAVKNHFLTGITLAPWIRILVDNRQFINWSLYWHRAAFLTLMATFNSTAALWDRFMHGKAIANQHLHPQPVFILGHPRTGTTHLHNLLSQDQRFAFCDTLMAGFPSSFLAMRPLQWLLAPMLDATRPMDGMAMSFQLPAEDEIATSGLSGGISPYLSLLLMNRRQHFARFLTLEDTSLAERSAWRSSFTWFMRKVTYACNRQAHLSVSRPGRGTGSGTGKEPLDALPLLIKSPVHTARVAAMLEIFPGARFIFIHRDPLEVFQSSMHMADSYFGYCSLHRQSEAEVSDYTLTQGRDMIAAYCSQRHLIPPGQLLEVSFADLEQDPVACLSQIYEKFGWENFDRMRPRLEPYTESLAGFRKNQHRPLPDGIPELVYNQWRQFFTEFDYSAPGTAVRTGGHMQNK